MPENFIKAPKTTNGFCYDLIFEITATDNSGLGTLTS